MRFIIIDDINIYVEIRNDLNVLNFLFSIIDLNKNCFTHTHNNNIFRKIDSLFFN